MNASARDASQNEAGAGDTVPVLRCSQRSNEPYVRNPERLYCPDDRQLYPQRCCLMDPTEDIELLQEHDSELLDELRTVVCEDMKDEY